MENQLFMYQKEELLAEQAVRDAHKMALKQAKKVWRDNYEFSKKSYQWKLLMKSNSDGLWIGKDECQQFANRILDY